MTRCYLCGSEEQVERHHVDWHHDNNDAGNVVPLCRRCHVEVHRFGWVTAPELAWIRGVVERARVTFTSK